jgi:2-amino-4-hydroxy-6-hydroxymethyldihydropteridine diphosphokinase
MSRRAHWIPAYIGLGSNLDDPVNQLRNAVRALAELTQSRLLSVSSFYGNPPMGPPDQPDYVNAAAAVLTELEPTRLMAALQAIERAAGRERAESQRWGPRRIDLDILVYGSRLVDREDLQIPHPGICERNFVLFPLLELAPELVIPGRGIVRQLARRSDASALQLLN